MELEELSVEELFSILPSSIRVRIKKECNCGNCYNETEEFLLRVNTSTEFGSNIRNKYDVNYSDWSKDLFTISYQSSLKNALINAIKNLKSAGFENRLLPINKGAK